MSDSGGARHPGPRDARNPRDTRDIRSPSPLTAASPGATPRATPVGSAGVSPTVSRVPARVRPGPKDKARGREHARAPRHFSTDDGSWEMTQAAQTPADERAPLLPLAEAVPELGPGRDASIAMSRGRAAAAANRPVADAAGDAGDDGDADDADDANLARPGDVSAARRTSRDAGDGASLASNESFTLRDRQDAINVSHPFGIRLWKPALYKKYRSQDAAAEEDIKAPRAGTQGIGARLGNLAWTLTFGVVLLLTCAISAAVVLLVAGWWDAGAVRYAKLMWATGWYLFSPFGKFVQMWFKEAYRDEDEGVGRSVEDYVEWQAQQSQSGSTGHAPAVFAPGRRREAGDAEAQDAPRPYRLFGRGKWTVGRVLFFAWFYVLFTPIVGAIALVAWLGVFSIPMGRMLAALHKHLRVHPLAIKYWAWPDGDNADHSQFSLVLSTTRAFGPRYYKYTVDGIPIVFINMLAAVAFVIVDFYTVQVLPEAARFVLSLISIVPLAYFIGQAVASISAQSSMSMGATINAFFSTIVEVFLYLVALRQGKGEMVEGSIIGSFMAGVVLLPGLSMCAGALNRKTQRFNPNSTGVTTTMLFFAAGGAFAPTMWYRAFGPEQLACSDACYPVGPEAGGPAADAAAAEGLLKAIRECQCWTSKVLLTKDEPIFLEFIRPFNIVCVTLLFIGYATGLVFTLRTHAALIWAAQEAPDEEEQGGHDAPNWNKRKSYAVLLGSTWLYALVAEILVDSVDVVLANVNISQKMLGLTIFALVPNTTEFMNAISFAIYGNVALSLEIGSAYALQVCLLQIPALVLWSLRYVADADGPLRRTVYTMQFSSWDIWVGVVCIFLYSNVHLEGKSNYFKGGVLILAYVILTAGYYFDTEQNGLSDNAAGAVPGMARFAAARLGLGGGAGGLGGGGLGGGGLGGGAGLVQQVLR